MCITPMCKSIQMSLDAHEEVATKGIYALAAMVRNLQPMHHVFAEAGSNQWRHFNIFFSMAFVVQK